ncbi:hypothetical protein RD1_2505 [Roseobacter denitrificans OCh 114]|uniref:Uncharacterized protein n=1 Tax=Roseobacter denitrificans (strain ATCC 33942 / OCh 114) TaxID=375451 RepID=Q166M9_ROSDO|nr:hypothetical protein RD1_2505 [Roseobacter denitrificans OCh 114]
MPRGHCALQPHSFPVAHPALGHLDPRPHPARDRRAEIGNQATLRISRRPLRPRGHTVQRQTMHHNGRPRRAMHDDTRTGFKNGAARGLIYLGHVHSRQIRGLRGAKRLVKSVFHDPVAAFPHHERGGIPVGPGQRQPKDKGVRLLHEATLGRANTQNAIHMRGVTLCAIPEPGLCFACPRARITRKDPRHLPPVQCRPAATGLCNEIHRRPRERRRSGNAPLRVIAQHIQSDKPCVFALVPLAERWIVQRVNRITQGMPRPVQRGGFRGKDAPPFLKKFGFHDPTHSISIAPCMQRRLKNPARRAANLRPVLPALLRQLLMVPNLRQGVQHQRWPGIWQMRTF